MPEAAHHLATQSESAKVVYVAIAANAAIAISKFIAAGFSGSTAMLAEGIHSTVDTGNELLLLLGSTRSARPPDARHPFGYGKVAYFWALIVALSMFAVGGGFAVYNGVEHIIHPVPLEDATWNYAVLALAAIFELYSWLVSRAALGKRRTADETLWQLVRTSKDPSVFTVFIEDTAALAGLAIAALGVFLGHALSNPYIDPAASILVGCILITASVVLARETGGLLVGESMDPSKLSQLREVIAGDPAVEDVGQLLTMQLGPEDVLLTADVRFIRTLSIDEVDHTIDRLEHRVREQNPAIQRIFFRPAQRRGDASHVKGTSDK